MNCTVLLPVHKGGAVLRTAIESILAQNERDFEFLIIDDASPDDSAEVIRSFARRDPRIRPVFHARNLGLAVTLNEGLKLASTDLIARIDHDDIALPDRLCRQIEYMHSHPEVAVAGSFVYHMGRNLAHDRLVELPVSHEEITATLPKHNCLYHPSVIMRKREITALGGYREEYKHAEDYDLWLRVSKIWRLANIPSPLLRYRFSIGGESIGKKWDQAHWAQMAIISYNHPDWSHDRVWSEAAAFREQQGREWFLEQVARGTIQELLNLGLLTDAWRVFWRYRRQIGRHRAWNVARDLGLHRFVSRKC